MIRDTRKDLALEREDHHSVQFVVLSSCKEQRVSWTCPHCGATVLSLGILKQVAHTHYRLASPWPALLCSWPSSELFPLTANPPCRPPGICLVPTSSPTLAPLTPVSVSGHLLFLIPSFHSRTPAWITLLSHPHYPLGSQLALDSPRPFMTGGWASPVSISQQLQRPGRLHRSDLSPRLNARALSSGGWSGLSEAKLREHLQTPVFTETQRNCFGSSQDTWVRWGANVFIEDGACIIALIPLLSLPWSFIHHLRPHHLISARSWINARPQT